jgi:biotin transport system permease protein
MIGALSARPTPYHRWRAGAKLAALCGFCTVLTLADTPLVPLLAIGLLLGMAARAGGWFVRAVLGDLKFPALIAAFIAAWHIWMGTAQAGLTLAATLLACIAAATMLSRTTSPAELLSAVDTFLACLRVPQKARRRLALAVALTLRFIPTLSARGRLLIDAHRVRSPRRAGWRVLPPLALGALDEADRTADALRARAHTE